MDIIVNEELKAYIDPLTQDEHDALERSLLAEGCRDALVLWGNVLIDGHNRYGICSKHGIPFNTVQNTRFKSMDDVHLWMIEQHLGRRSVSDYQRGVLALRKRDILETRRRAEQEQLRRESDGEAAINDANSEANLLNEAGIITVFNSYGTGIRLWGNRSAAFAKTIRFTQNGGVYSLRSVCARAPWPSLLISSAVWMSS